MNSGNFVHRIYLANRRMWVAIGITVMMSSIAIAGWVRPVAIKVIAERPVSGMSNSDCVEYAEIMCNN